MRGLLLALGVLGIGCSASHPGDAGLGDAAEDAGPDVEAIVDVLERIDEALCERAVRCELDPGWSARRPCEPFDRDAARDAATRAPLDEEAVRRCEADLSAPCDEPLDDIGGFFGHSHDPDSCNRILEWTHACDVCTAEEWCRTRRDCEGIECVAVRALGEPCDPASARCHSASQCRDGVCRECGSDSDCDSSDRCVYGAWTCEPRPTSGDPCRFSSECSDPLICATDGVCSTPGGLGTSCTRYEQCATGTFCDGASCQLLPGLGEPCGMWPGCAEGSRCAGGGTCVPAVEPGASCIATATDPCLAPDLRCEAGACREAREGDACIRDDQCGENAPFCNPRTNTCARDPLGRSCFEPEGCEGRTECNGSFCVVPRGIGEACTESNPCEGGRCVDALCVDVVLPTEACDDAHLCPVGWTCHAGTCVAFPAAGEPCVDVCREGICREGRCQLRPAGEPCETWRECEHGCGRTGGGVCRAVQTTPGGPCDDDTFGRCAEGLTCGNPTRHAGGSYTFECLAPCTD